NGFRRFPQGRAARDGAGCRIDGQERIAALVADIEVLAVWCERNAARLGSHLERRRYLVGGDVDDRHGGGAFVRYVREGRRERACAQACGGERCYPEMTSHGHWSTFALRAPVCALGTAHRAHASSFL